MATKVERPDEGSPDRPRVGRVRGFVREHARIVAVGALIAVALGVFAFLWFRPDKLLVDKVVDDAAPAAPAPGSSAPPGSAGAPVSPRIVSSGSFRDLEHPTSGTAKIVELADGARVVRFERFRTSNGPDLVVILSSTPATENDWGAYDDGAFVNLGALRGNVGAQNYALPATIDLRKYRSIVVWCRRFNVAFGAAPIT